MDRFGSPSPATTSAAPADLTKRHPATVQVVRWFEYYHLREGLPRDTACEMQDTARWMVDELPDGPELTAGLRKLLEAKDCFVRAALDAVRGTEA